VYTESSFICILNYLQYLQLEFARFDQANPLSIFLLSPLSHAFRSIVCMIHSDKHNNSLLA
jgi:hypothetical protein